MLLAMMITKLCFYNYREAIGAVSDFLWRQKGKSG